MKFKDLFIISLAVFILFSCGRLRNRNQQTSENKTDTTLQQTGTPKIPKDQYRIAENLKDSRDQIIDLIKGPSTFEISYEGTGRFIAEIKHVDGKLLTVLADRNGSFKDKKLIDVPETTAYILEVRCTGYWSVYRE